MPPMTRASASALIGELVERRRHGGRRARHARTPPAYRLGHEFGNRRLTGFVATVFGKQLRDMLSGYR